MIDMAYQESQLTVEEEIARTRIPKQGEVLGIVAGMLGAGKMSVDCEDGNTRICRIPGKIRKKIWVRPGDLVLVEPWSVQPKERADVVWRYTRVQAGWLQRKGYIKRLVVEF